MISMKKIICNAILLVFCISAFCQPVIDSALSSPLFEENDILNITLSFDVKETITDITERDSHPATLTYKDENGDEVSIPLNLKVRGQTRSKTAVCRFPPLELNFKKKGNQGNLFQGQDKLKLVTHCNNGSVFEQYVINEYLVYKAYNLLTDKSFKVRLCSINYIDTSEKKKEPIQKIGFLIEDIDVLAARNGMEESKRNLANQDQCDHSILDIYTVFQYMIGNTDWSIVEFHNAKLITDSEGGSIIPIPYDFDYSGIVSTSYAQPPANLPIQSVQERIFRGYCRPSGEYEKIFSLFQQKKKEIYEVFLTNELLNDRNKSRIERYLDSFYAVLDNPKKSEKEITEACR